MSEEEVVDWAVPVARKLIPRNTIPPVGIKPSISKVRQFGQQIKYAFPDEIPLDS